MSPEAREAISRRGKERRACQVLGSYFSNPLSLAYLMPAGLARLASRGTWQLAPHLVLLNEYLLGVAAGDIRRLMVFMPPRHGKSQFVSQYFPAWFLGRFPDDQILLASYEDEFAASWGGKARDVLFEWGLKVFGVEVSPTVSAASRWGIKGHVGEMNTAGVGAGLTGKGAKILIIDDPVKGYEWAVSKTIRDKQWNWYQSEAYTRLEPDGRIILLMTRWHEDDLAGRILKEGKNPRGEPETWTVLKLPALSEGDDSLGRDEGTPLWPQRYSLQRLKEIQGALTPFWWAALYQQRPAPAEGGIFKRSWFMNRYFTLPPGVTDLIQSWDMAFKDLKTSSKVCGQVWGRKGADRYLIYQIRDTMDFPTTLRAVETLTKMFPTTKSKYIEEAANGYAVIQTLKHKIEGIIPVSPQQYGSKEARASAVSYLWEAGNVWIPDASVAPWVEDFIEECVTFPNSYYKDQVDTMTQALLKMEGRKSCILGPGGVEQESKWRDGNV